MNPNDASTTILLVDDEADIREVLELTLQDQGYRVLTAENGAQGLETYCREMPPLVLTDIKMPGMDGIELLRRIKRENPESEVLMITGHGDMDLAIKSLKYEATDFITKPINVEALEIALKRARDRIRMRQTLREYTENLERLLKEKTELQDHLASLGMMIGSISHGIKGMLTGLDGGMYILDSGLKKENTEKVHEGCDVIRTMVGRIRKLVQDILFYAKERKLNWEKVDVLRFAEEVVAGYRNKIEQQGIGFVREFDASVGDCEIDPSAVHSALINILENAVDACLKDRSKASHTVTFGVLRQGDEIVFTVTDDGVGMDADTRARLFELFFSSKGHKGTGFGLFISNEIVQQHGGVIKVDSFPGRGTTFRICLPASSADSTCKEFPRKG